MVETKPQFTRFRHEAVSTALRQAMLRTERHRIYGVLAVLAILAVVVVVRWLLVPNAALASATHMLLMLAAAYGVYETAMLRIVGRAHRADCDLPVWLLRLPCGPSGGKTHTTNTEQFWTGNDL